jgi:hypothetical protein
VTNYTDGPAPEYDTKPWEKARDFPVDPAVEALVGRMDGDTVWSSPPPAAIPRYDIIKTCDVLIRQAENLLKRAMHHTVPKARAVELESEANGIIFAVRVLKDQYGLIAIEIPAEFQPPEVSM